MIFSIDSPFIDLGLRILSNSKFTVTYVLILPSLVSVNVFIIKMLVIISVNITTNTILFFFFILLIVVLIFTWIIIYYSG